jgi:hypothetical protein
MLTSCGKVAEIERPRAGPTTARRLIHTPSRTPVDALALAGLIASRLSTVSTHLLVLLVSYKKLWVRRRLRGQVDNS